MTDLRGPSLPVPAALALSLLAGCAPPATPLSGGTPPRPPPALVPRVDGAELRDALGQPLLLRGVAFGNRVWQDDPLPDEHHSELDFDRVVELGMNSVRFYLNYRTFEDDQKPGVYKPEGWEWLDRNVAWARARNVYLVLNMHVPPGGYQSLGKGKALWHDPREEQRFIALWQAIAARYRGEPAIAGYDILNEPVVPDSPEQWRGLAERTITAIRQVDPDHAIFVERVNAVAGDWKEDANRNFFRVSDPNVVYEFHFYKPFHFTHQGAPWVEFVAEDQQYPNATQVGAEWFLLKLEQMTADSPRLPVGDSEWTYYPGQPFRIDDPTLVVGKPSLVCAHNSGKAYFDDVVVEELDDDGKVARVIANLELGKKAGWYFWTKDGTGARTEERSGHDDGGSLAIGGTRDDANASAEIWRFRTEAGKTYRASGWMKGEKIPDGARCQIRLDLFSSPVPVHAVDRAFLAQELDAYVAWGKSEGVPLYLGEFGTIRASFEQQRGGERWTADMLELLLERQLGFAYHDWHEESFGVYFGDGVLPSPTHANQALLAVFREKLRATTTPTPTATP